MTAWNLTLSGDAEHQVFPVHLPIYALSQMIPSKSQVVFFLHRNVSPVHTVAPAKASRGIGGDDIPSGRNDRLCF